MSVQGQGSVSAVLDAIRTITRMIRSGSLTGPHTHTARNGGPIQTDSTIRFRNALQPMFDSDSQMLNTNLNADLWRGQRYYNQASKPKYAAKGDLAWDGSSFWVWNGQKWIANQSAFPNENANQVFAGPSSGAAAAPTFRALVPADIPGLPASIITSGVLPVGFGGTGSSAFAAGSVIFSNGTILTQDNTEINWNDANDVFTVGSDVSTGGINVHVYNRVFGDYDGSGGARPAQYYAQGQTNPNLKSYFGFDTTNKQIVIQCLEETVAWHDVILCRDGGNVGIGTSGAKTKLDVRGSLSVGLVTKTANYSMVATDFGVLANASGGAFTVTLPAANTEAGMLALVIKTDSTGNAVTVAGAGTDTIEGAGTISMSTQYVKLHLISDGVNTWYKLGAHSA